MLRGRVYVLQRDPLPRSIVLLFGTFQSVGDTLLIMMPNLPLAIIRVTIRLWLWGTNFNISAAVGYIAVFGVGVPNGVVLVSSIGQAHADRESVRDAILRGCEIRFRPILVSGIAAIIGILRAAVIQRPPARAVIGRLISSTIFTPLVLPAVY